MKQGYLKKLVVGGLLMGSLAGLAACGSDAGNSVTPTGKVVKGPVSGATILDKNGVAFATTDAGGVFAMTAQGPYTTTGGTYIPLNADGTSGAPVAAPPLSAPAGYSQITPLSTIVASAPAGQQAAVEAALTAALAKMGVTDLKSADLSVKTDTNAAAIVFAESVGAVLTTANASATSGEKAAITTALISAVQSLSTATGTPTASQITSAVTTQVTAAAPALTTAMTTAISTAADGAAAVANGSLPTQQTTGSTGGTGGTGGLK